MPPRKKNTGAQASLGENQQVEPSVDHVSMHTEGTKSSEEVRQPQNRCRHHILYFLQLGTLFSNDVGILKPKVSL